MADETPVRAPEMPNVEETIEDRSWPPSREELAELRSHGTALVRHAQRHGVTHASAQVECDGHPWAIHAEDEGIVTFTPAEKAHYAARLAVPASWVTTRRSSADDE
jgi:hypothetical protein